MISSPYVTAAGYVSTGVRSQGSILHFIEDVFSLPSLSTDDAVNDNLGDMMTLPPGIGYAPNVMTLFMVSSSERVSAFKEVDDCAKVAKVFVAATGQSSASHSVRPLAPGSCTARIADEAGNTLAVPIVVK